MFLCFLNSNIDYGNISQKTRYVNDELDTINVKNGVVNISKAFLNSLWGIVITANIDDIFIVQTFISQHNTIKTRTKQTSNNIWSEWKL